MNVMTAAAYGAIFDGLSNTPMMHHSIKIMRYMHARSSIKALVTKLSRWGGCTLPLYPTENSYQKVLTPTLLIPFFLDSYDS